METDRFRAWLARRLLGTVYAHIRISDDDLDGVAKRLGVDPDLLLEVRVQARTEQHARGRAPPRSNQSAVVRRLNDQALYQLKVRLPPAVRAAWLEECRRRGVVGAALLRSLVHRYLLGEREPEPAQFWVWQGELFRNYREHKLAEKATISRGARTALMRRAAARGTRGMFLVRALMLEALRGEHMGIPLVTAGGMYEDVGRYILGDCRGRLTRGGQGR